MPDKLKDSEMSDEFSIEKKRPQLEQIPIGLISEIPELEDPIFYQTSVSEDGKTQTLGPFELSAAHIREWRNSTDDLQIDQIVRNGQLRQSTAQMLKEGTFLDGILEMLETGYELSPSRIERFIPGDLQRLVAEKILGR